jgi:hypothetical protein
VRNKPTVQLKFNLQDTPRREKEKTDFQDGGDTELIYGGDVENEDEDEDEDEDEVEDDSDSLYNFDDVDL